MLAAIVGLLVESAGFQAAFAAHGEHPADAIARVKPLAAVLAEGVDEVWSDLLVARVEKRSTPLFIFCGTPPSAERASWASRHGVPIFDLPADLDRLRQSLESLPVSRRLGARAERTTGSLFFVDESGARWSVFDRRRNERRKELVERRFVSESGETRCAELTVEQALLHSADALSEQFAHAQSVTA